MSTLTFPINPDHLTHKSAVYLCTMIVDQVNRVAGERGGLDDIPLPAQHVYFADNFHAHVCQSSLAEFLWESHGLFLPNVREALTAIEATAALKIYEDALRAYFEDDGPRNSFHQLPVTEQTPLGDTFDALDEPYRALTPIVPEICIEYIAAHPDVFPTVKNLQPGPISTASGPKIP